MLPAINMLLTEATAYDWSSVSMTDITNTANGLSSVMAPVVVTVTSLVLGFKLFKRFANKI